MNSLSSFSLDRLPSSLGIGPARSSAAGANNEVTKQLSFKREGPANAWENLQKPSGVRSRWVKYAIRLLPVSWLLYSSSRSNPLLGFPAPWVCALHKIAQQWEKVQLDTLQRFFFCLVFKKICPAYTWVRHISRKRPSSESVSVCSRLS